jgi:hypothetical protein
VSVKHPAGKRSSPHPDLYGSNLSRSLFFVREREQQDQTTVDSTSGARDNRGLDASLLRATVAFAMGIQEVISTAFPSSQSVYDLETDSFLHSICRLSHGQLTDSLHEFFELSGVTTEHLIVSQLRRFCQSREFLAEQ